MDDKAVKIEVLVSQEIITQKIFFIRGKKVMFDRHLAQLYEVDTKVLNQAVQRNIERFPEDFCFQLNEEEFQNWKSQIVTSNFDKMGLRKRSYVFTEQGVAMLSSVLNSPRAVQVNIQIMRTFTKLREMMLTHVELKHKIEDMESEYRGKFKEHDNHFRVVFDAIRKLIEPPKEKKKKAPFGFHPPSLK